MKKILLLSLMTMSIIACKKTATNNNDSDEQKIKERYTFNLNEQIDMMSMNLKQIKQKLSGYVYVIGDNLGDKNITYFLEDKDAPIPQLSSVIEFSNDTVKSISIIVSKDFSYTTARNNFKYLQDKINALPNYRTYSRMLLNDSGGVERLRIKSDEEIYNELKDNPYYGALMEGQTGKSFISNLIDYRSNTRGLKIKKSK